jgi:hypothetical protein
VNRALRAATIGVLLIAPVALSSCSAGQIPQTSTQNRDKVGAMGTVGAIALREVKLPFPTGRSYSSGGDAELTAAIANGGTEGDVLVSVTGDDFSGVRVAGTGAAATTTSSALTSVPGTPVGTVAPSGEAAPTTSGGASSSAAGTSASGTAAGATAGTSVNQTGPTTAATGIGGATGTPTGAVPTTPASSGSGVSLAVPAGATLYLGENSPHVFLTGLNRSLTAGQVLRITFTFQRAGSVTVDAFVAGPTSYVPNSSSFDFEMPSQANVPGNEAGGGGVGGSSGGNG